jgi:YVTN family beta-propeller protein/VCBS repeat-containing protein
MATFTVTASDGRGGSTQQELSVPISPTVVGNRAPVAGTPSVGTPDRITGRVSGNLNFTDPDNNPLTYSIPAQPSAGTVALSGSTYTFTPTTAARNAAATGGPTSVTITIAASDGQLSTPVSWSVPIIAPNRAPTAGTPTVGAPTNSTGAVSGNLNFTDPDNNPLTYSVPTQPVTGTVTLSGATYTYTPTKAARDAAAAGGASSASITATANDGLATTNVTFTVPISPTPAANTAPTVSASQSAPDQTTGAITVSVNAVDPDGNPLTYIVTGHPTSGSLTGNAAGQFTYTPTIAARMLAGTSTIYADFDSFTVSVSDGQTSTPVTINVAVLPAVLSAPTGTAAVGANPMGVAVSDTKIYVANQASNTVSVLDRTNPAATAVTIAVVASPIGIALGPTGSNRAYVAGTNGVSVINTVTNQVVGTVALAGGQSYGIAVSPNGQRLYVTMSGTHQVAVINANTYTLASTVAVGTTPTAITLNDDGTRAYVANYSSNTVSILNTSITTPTVVSTVTVGANPFGIAATAGGSLIYVANSGTNTVSVINTTTTTPTVTSISVGANPFGLAMSPDQALIYVANGVDTVSIINATTKTVMDIPVLVDSAAENNWHWIAVSPDGRQLYVTDLADRAVRILTVNRGNTFPQFGTATVGSPDATTGAVSGVLTVSDTDGDTLTYSPYQPSNGTFTITTTGAYTFTPTQAARDAAAQTPGVDLAILTVFTGDGHGGSTAQQWSVPIAPTVIANRAPVVGTPSVGTPDRITGTVGGSLNFTDPDNNPLAYSIASQPSSGTVILSGAAYTFTPTAAARNAAATGGPTSATLTVTASDGQATTPVSWTVPIIAPNRAPTAGTPTVGTPSTATGAVSGNLNFTDPDNNPLTYTVPAQPATGTVTLSGATYTYTPTKAARDAAANAGPSSASITVTANDGLATTSVTFAVPITPSPATATPSQGTPDQTTGAIVVNLNAVDPRGNPLTYTVATAPISGSLAATGAGQYTYTPTVAARLTAGLTSGPDLDSFIVSVSNGTATTSVTVSVAVLPAVLSAPTGTAAVGVNPMGVAVSDIKVYVANQASNTISVIDRANPTATALTITVVASPVAIALGPAGSNRAYVAGTNGVSVINTATNQVVGTIALTGGQSYGIAVAPNGGRVYVTMSGTSQVATINANTTTNTYTLASTIAVGTTPTAITLNADGTRAYVANYSSNTVSILNTSTTTPTVVSTVIVGANPFGIAATADGSRIYVANSGTNTVSVINTTTATPTVTSITVGANPFGLTMSPDRSLIYVANGVDTLSIINTKTNSVIGTPTAVDSAPESNWHWIAVSPDGRQIYVSDLADRNVRSLTINYGVVPPIVRTGVALVGANVTITGYMIGQAFSADGTRAVITTDATDYRNGGSLYSQVAVINTTTGAQIGTTLFFSGLPPAAPLLNADGTRAVITIAYGNRSETTVIDTTSGTRVGTTVSVLGQQAQTVLSAKGTRAVITTTSSDLASGGTRVAMIDTTTGAQIGTTVFVQGSQSVTWTADGDHVLITTRVGDGTDGFTRVTVIDTITGTQTGTPVIVPGTWSVGPLFGADRTHAVIVTDGHDSAGRPITRVTAIDITLGSQTGTTVDLPGIVPNYIDSPAKAVGTNSALIVTRVDDATTNASSTLVALIATATGTQIGTTVTLAGAPSTSPMPAGATRAVLTTYIADSTGYNILNTKVSVINTTTGAQTGTTLTLTGRVNGSPLLSADATRALIATDAGAVIINTTTGAQTGTTFALTGTPKDFQVSADGTRALITTTYDSDYSVTTTRVTVINTATGTPIGTALTFPGYTGSPVLSGDGSHALFAWDTGTNYTQVAVVDTTTGRQTGTTLTLVGGIYGVQLLSEDGTHALITTNNWNPYSYSGTTQMTTINTTTGSQVGGTLIIPGEPETAPIFSADGTHGLITTIAFNSYTQIATTRVAVLRIV